MTQSAMQANSTRLDTHTSKRCECIANKLAAWQVVCTDLHTVTEHIWVHAWWMWAEATAAAVTQPGVMHHRWSCRARIVNKCVNAMWLGEWRLREFRAFSSGWVTDWQIGARINTLINEFEANKQIVKSRRLNIYAAPSECKAKRGNGRLAVVL